MALNNVQLTPQLVQAVRDAVDIVSLASDHTQLKKAGRQYEGLCPLHKEKTPSFSIDPDKGVFYCFGCGQGGDAIRLHMLATGDDFPAAIENLAQRYGIPLPTRTVRHGAAGAERDVTGALTAAADFFRHQLSRQDAPRQYLADRQVPAEMIERFDLGYAPDGWRHLIQALSPRIPLADLVAAGLTATSDQGSGEPYDRFRNRLIFPIRTPSGRLVGFGGRTLGDDKAKYINTSETEQFRKGQLLYGLYEARRSVRENRRVALVEGYFDVIGCAVAEVDAVASMGTSLTPEQARLLTRYVDEVIIGYDGDNAGQAAFRRALPLLQQQGLGVRHMRLAAGDDPDSLRLRAGKEAVTAAAQQATDAVMAELERLIEPGAGQDPRSQGRVANEVADLLRPIVDPIVRMGYGRLAAQRLRVPEQMLLSRLGPETAGRQAQRARGGDGSPPAAEAATPERRLTRSLEEEVLARLLAAKEAAPAQAQLLPPDAFFDPACRRLYQEFCVAYGQQGRPPDTQGVQRRLPAGSPETAHLARIVQDEGETSLDFTLGELLAKLDRRWLEQRRRQLVADLETASRGGDLQRQQELLVEKQEISRRLHRRG